jgi:rSAM/selenodomain-associated transferase 1
MPIEVLVMAKAPEPEQVKTRLHGLLSPQQAADLQAALIEDTLAGCVTTANLLASPCQGSPSRRVRVRLACAPGIDHPFFRRLSERTGIGLVDQGPGDLGERMWRLQARSLELGALAVVFLGVDAPAMEPLALQQAMDELEQASVVLGPAEDGGYYLLGSIRPTPYLFHDLPWGTSQVLETTRRRLRGHEITWRELPASWDVDRPEDLVRLKQLLAAEPGRAPHCARLIKAFEA